LHNIPQDTDWSLVSLIFLVYHMLLSSVMVHLITPYNHIPGWSFLISTGPNACSCSCSVSRVFIFNKCSIYETWRDICWAWKSYTSFFRGKILWSMYNITVVVFLFVLFYSVKERFCKCSGYGTSFQDCIHHSSAFLEIAAIWWTWYGFQVLFKICRGVLGFQRASNSVGIG